MHWAKVLLYNCLVFSLFWTICEGSYFIYKQVRVGITCEYDWVLYGSCGGIHITYQNHDLDGGNTVQINTDALGARMGSTPLPKYENTKIVVVGDSFIEADEMDYSETLYGRLNKSFGIETYALGYSSWNPIQYLDAIKKINIKNTHYVVFLMGNDVNPNYVRSVYGELHPGNSDTFIFRTIKSSLIYKLYKKTRNSLTEFTKDSKFVKEDKTLEEFPEFSINDWKKFDINNWQNCEPMGSLFDSPSKQKPNFDYLVYSKSSKCWPPIYKRAYSQFLQKTNELSDYVTEHLTGQLTYIWIPPGWAFKNQNSQGRLHNSVAFPNSITVTQKGVFEQFKIDVNTDTLINAEELITKELKKCTTECKDIFYYTMDGHWTPNTHLLLAKVLSSLHKSSAGQ